MTANTLRYRVELRALINCLEKIQLPSPCAILDAGAGSGEMTKRLSMRIPGAQVTGLEPFEENFRLLQKNFSNLQGAKAVRGALEAMPFKDSTFELVVSTQVFEHIEDHERAASEAVRVAKPGATILISVPHPPEMVPNSGHIRPGYTEDDLLGLFASFNLMHLHTEYFLTLPTMNRFHFAERLPLRGVYIPVLLIDCELGRCNAQRKASQPYGMSVLFRKQSAAVLQP